MGLGAGTVGIAGLLCAESVGVLARATEASSTAEDSCCGSARGASTAAAEQHAAAQEEQEEEDCGACDDRHVSQRV